KKIIGLHGWLDNSNTYTLLGPYLAAKGYHLVALDTVGHGRSSHLSVDSQYTTDKTVAYLHEVVESLGWEKPHIMGHSMGAGIALAYAGVFPEKVDKLVMIEGLGAYTSSAAKGCKNLRRAIEALQKADLLAAKLGTRSKVYASFKDAVDARVRVVSSYPGNQTLSEEAATWLL
ncbi:Alpha/Beta hydrolase protein, partial [Ochromonadaceae sp. CCMP2298]